jgi:pimeloyl-ACP methyl ester carboxylesterase
MEQPVEFQSCGLTIRGVLFGPDDASGLLPTVVMAGGWCYTKEIVMPHVARILLDVGVQTLAFDYRGFGESDGDRRQHIDPWMQIEDYRNAISYVEGRDDVDAGAIGVFGISYSGGHSLILAAIDPRIRAVVSLVPVIDGYANMRRAHGEFRFRDLEHAILADRRSRFAGKAEGYLPHATEAPNEELSVWPFPITARTFAEIKRTEAPRYDKMSTVESTELLLAYNVFPYLGRILNTPVLVLVAEGDNLTLWDLEIAAYNSIPSPAKELVIMPSISHMSLYSDRADTNVAARHTTRWFETHLRSLDRVGPLAAHV